MSVQREKIRFISGGAECAAWHYPGTNGACVVMAGGTAVTKEPGTDVFARRFHDDGFSVLAFEHRRLGESGGMPRQVVRVKDELADWQAAIACARGLPGVDPARLALWGFSLGGGHVIRTAARTPGLAAAIAQTPLADGPAAVRNATRHQTPSAMLRLTLRGVLDAVGGILGRRPLLVPLVGPPGTVATLSSPDVLISPHPLDPGGSHPDWQQEVAARSTFGISGYRPGRDAPRVRCPLMVLVCDQDQAALAEPGAVAARQAPRGELLRLPGGHYAPFLDVHEQAVQAQLSFLRRHLSDGGPADRPGPAVAGTAAQPEGSA
ncbi:alpha/beta hydrolase [Peterkaempfera sp. SMS 1(5)a]|uniref:alpha/beta hydrolase n=1 Tax=Peterkaempfera podocarpi TaxID=3232308 RepID=UPI00366F3CEB